MRDEKVTRKEAFRSALLNTCVRLARGTYPDLVLSNCWENKDFLEHARLWLHLPFFTEKQVEPIQEDARRVLLLDIQRRLDYWDNND